MFRLISIIICLPCWRPCLHLCESHQCYFPLLSFIGSNQSASHFFLPSSLFPHVSRDVAPTTQSARCLRSERLSSCSQLRGVISVSFLGHWLCDALSHWEPLGATRVPILPPRRRSRQTSPIKAPSASYTHRPPSDLEQSSRIQTSRLTLRTQSPRSCWVEVGGDKERLFPDCRRERDRGRGEEKKKKRGGEDFEIFNREAVSPERGGFVLFYI